MPETREDTATVERVVISMPHPPASLSPNGRAHWRTKAADAKQVRRDAHLLTWREQQGIITTDDTRWPAASMRICWMFAGRQPDDDNVIARLKPVRDGIADAGLVADDGLIRVEGVTFERVKRSEQAVVITLTRSDTTQHDG